MALSADGRLLISASYGNTLKMQEVETGCEVRRFVGHTHWVNEVALSWDGRIGVSASEDKTLRGMGGEYRARTPHPARPQKLCPMAWP